MSSGRGRASVRRSAASCLMAVSLVVVASGCASIKRVAINRLGDALVETGTTFASDDDPELIAQAVPFSLKLIESLLAESPRHEGMLVAAARGFTQYGYAFVQQDADEMEAHDFRRSEAMRQRARRLYLRARNYGIRALEQQHRGFQAMLAANPRSAASTIGPRGLEALYWTGAAWGAAIALSKDDPETVAEVPQMEALIDRAYALDPDWNRGALHSFLVTYEMARQGATGKPADRARRHFERAMALGQGQDPAPMVAFAEAVDVQEQNRAEFRELIERALAIDADAIPEQRLMTLVMQRRARWLLSRIDELFLLNETDAADQAAAE